jgi:hypothetical protein
MLHTPKKKQRDVAEPHQGKGNRLHMKQARYMKIFSFGM